MQAKDLVVMDLPLCETLAVFHVGDVLRKFREGRGLTIEQLSEQTGFGKGTISQIERGEGNPRQKTLDSLARFFGLSGAAGLYAYAMVDPAVVKKEAAAMEAAGFDPTPLSDQAETLGRTYDSLRDVNSRRLLLEMAERFRAAEPLQPVALDSSRGSTSGTPAKADEELPRIRRTRGA